MSDIRLVNNNDHLVEINPLDLYRKKTKRVMRTSILLPSQQQSYAVCTEVIRDWFLERFPEKFFTSVFVDGSHSFDEFRKLSSINKQLKKTNPLLAITPNIDYSYNREWIDSVPEIPLLMRRSKFEGIFFSDIEHNKGIHLQLILKSIKMGFLFKMRLDTRGQQLDMVEYLKLKHRAGWSETLYKDMDIHVPKRVMCQLAYDAGFELDANGEPKDTLQFLQYLNSHSLIPFIYKLRCTTGNNEYFIRVPNCVVHIKPELPSMDDGERVNMISTNYTVELNLEVEMTAPYCYSYFTQNEKCDLLNGREMQADAAIMLMQAKIADIPNEDKNHWALLTTTEYGVEEENLRKPLDIDLNPLFCGTDIGMVIDYTRRSGLSPALFLNFIFANNGEILKYEIDWKTLKIHIEEGITVDRTIIGIYVDMRYVNNTIIQVRELNRSDRV